jgi:hypothetical protein
VPQRKSGSWHAEIAAALADISRKQMERREPETTAGLDDRPPRSAANPLQRPEQFWAH